LDLPPGDFLAESSCFLSASLTSLGSFIPVHYSLESR
jgi:hypothetical protein